MRVCFPCWVPHAWCAWCEGLFLSTLCIHGIPLHKDSPLSSFSSWQHLIPSYSLDLASFVHLWCLFHPSLGSFLGYLQWCECYVNVSMGWGELRILQLHHLPKRCFLVHCNIMVSWTQSTSAFRVRCFEVHLSSGSLKNWRTRWWDPNLLLLKKKLGVIYFLLSMCLSLF